MEQEKQVKRSLSAGWCWQTNGSLRNNMDFLAVIARCNARRSTHRSAGTAIGEQRSIAPAMAR